MGNNQRSQADRLERYRVAFENISLQKNIAKAIEKMGYTAEKITKGEVILQATRQIYDQSASKTDIKLRSHNILTKKRDKLEALYRLHRKTAKIVFRNDSETLKKLKMFVQAPNAYVK